MQLIRTFPLPKKEIPTNAFLYTKNSELLYLGNNQLMSLEQNLFVNTPNLKSLDLNENNLTQFSPELISHHKEFNSLINADLSDIDAKQIVDCHPKLAFFHLDDNEMACTRIIEIIRTLDAKQINTEPTGHYKTRYYPQEKVLRGFLCNPDISWMASNHRKENSYQIESEELEIDHRLSDLMSMIDEEVSKMDQRLTQLETKIDSLIKLVVKAQ